MAITTPAIDVAYDGDSREVLLAGFAEYGLAGLTAVNYLVEQLELEPQGHVRATGLPSITPFESGTPRHHSRLFTGPDTPLVVLVGELPIPEFVADEFAESLFEWAARDRIGEIVVCSGIPTAHGPDDHKPFYIATESYQRQRLAETDLTPMRGGYLDGLNGSLMARGLTTGRPTCLVTTPAHAQSPDAEAALRILNAVIDVYELDIDTAPLENFASEVAAYYTELAQRVERTGEEQFPDDRMYM
jgi:uncharacterized protein